MRNCEYHDNSLAVNIFINHAKYDLIVHLCNVESEHAYLFPSRTESQDY